MLVNDMFCVYIHELPDGRKYVGMTRSIPEERFNNGKGYVNNTAFYAEIVKTGWNNIKHVIVAEGLNINEAANLEVELIREYNTTSMEYGFNTHKGGRVHTTSFSEAIIKTQSAVKRYRKRAGLTQRELAEKAGLFQAQISAFENFKIIPSFEVAEKLASILGCTAEGIISPFGTGKEV